MRITAMQSAVQGVQRAEQQLERSAANLSEAFTVSVSDEAASGPAPDVVEATVGQLRAVAAYKANLASLKTADEVNGVLVELAARR